MSQLDLLTAALRGGPVLVLDDRDVWRVRALTHQLAEHHTVQLATASPKRFERDRTFEHRQ